MTHLIYKEFLIQQVMQLLNTMKTCYPGLYRHLDENSLPVYPKNDAEIYPSGLEAYIATLEEQMMSYTEAAS
jgi:hypothetical protein